jgi:hypothetical protein
MAMFGTKRKSRFKILTKIVPSGRGNKLVIIAPGLKKR